jgi:hypothetical protein
MWSFPQPPPSKRLSCGAMAIIPAMFLAFVLWGVLGLDKRLAMFVAWLHK